MLDGELYVHGVHLQDINKLVQRGTEHSTDLKLVVFDAVCLSNPDQPFMNRVETLDRLKDAI